MSLRRTKHVPPPSESPKGYGYICFDCAELAVIDEEFNIMVSVHRYGTCDNCGEKDQPRMSVEMARFKALVERAEADGEATEG